MGKDIGANARKSKIIFCGQRDDSLNTLSAIKFSGYGSFDGVHHIEPTDRSGILLGVNRWYRNLPVNGGGNQSGQVKLGDNFFSAFRRGRVKQYGNG